ERSQRPRWRARALRYRPRHRLLSGRVLQHGPRRPGKSHDLRGGDRGVSRAPASDRQRPQHGEARIPVPRPRSGRPLVRHRGELAASPRGRRRRLRGSGVHQRTSSRDRLARRAGGARRRRPRRSRHARFL
ncbi:MAG: hypothetical protein AVDCRST_MAG45-2594, partial [uncultured Solirubrobacterales bacterium]